MKARQYLIAALASSLAVLDNSPHYVRLCPCGAALRTLHWVAGVGHLLNDGPEHRRELPVGLKESSI